MKLKEKTVVRVNASVLLLKGKSIIIAYWRGEQTTSVCKQFLKGPYKY